MFLVLLLGGTLDVPEGLCECLGIGVRRKQIVQPVQEKEGLHLLWK
jgi:hypothetical protein